MGLKLHSLKVSTLLLMPILLMAAHAADLSNELSNRPSIRLTDELTSCHIDNYRQEILCGSFSVYENRRLQTGRKIDIEFAVIPAVIDSAHPDPLVIFPGGPGQAAKDMGPLVRIAFSEIHQSRDIVLIDQRGMGSSHPLDCEIPEFTRSGLTNDANEEQLQNLLKDCLAALDADVRLYTQDIANQDFHDILVSLGYEKINIYGVSWGTRSAQIYAQQYPDHVRSVILDGSAPFSNKIPLFASEDAERALQKTFRDCSLDESCNLAFPNLAVDFQRALALFGDEGLAVSLPDPTSGLELEFILTREQFVNNLRGVLYVADLVRLLPLVVEEASRGEYRTLAAMATYMSQLQGDGMSIGASLTILCSEELSRINSDEIAASSTVGFVGDAFIKVYQNACAVWPRADVPDIYNAPEVFSIPSLILSGDIDPVTPPRWGERMAEIFTNSVHLVASNTGHNVSTAKCADELIARFVEQASTENIDGSCLAEIQRPSFFVSPSGPAGLSRDD